MQRLLSFTLSLLLAVAAQTGAAADDAQSVEKLFNGKDLANWQWVSDREGAKMSEVWTVKEGILHCTGNPRGYIRTTRDDYRDYALTVEWRWPEGSQGGNNGVLVHTSTPGAIGVWPKSIEVQLASGNAGDFWVIGTELDVPNEETRKLGRRHLNLTDDSEKPIGQWNTMEITCRGDEILVKVNGDRVNHATNCSETQGAISLQSEGAPIEFRKVELRPLPGERKTGNEGERAPADQGAVRRRVLPTPTHAEVRYGPHPRNVLDLYLADSDEPTPLVLYIHGGGFRGGDKGSLSPGETSAFLNAGWSVAAINYRLTDTAPAPAAYLDCARALQFLRHNAKKWGLNPALVASTGGSAGAGTSMWIAFHDDLADPESDDPIARESTRLTCIVVQNGQSSYDPRFAEQIGIPRPNFERHQFFLPFYGITRTEIDTPRAHKLYDEAAPITYLSKDDPPALLNYSYANEEVTKDSALGLVVHHPKFGVALKEQMDKLGIECIVQYRDPVSGRMVRHGESGPPVTSLEFIAKHFERAQQSDR